MNAAGDAFMGIFGMKRLKKATKAKKRPRQPKLSTLIDKADKLTSQYIRQKHADHAGMVKCVTCETVLKWQDSHCAHYIERGKKETRWLEENLWPACSGCNVFHKERHKRRYTRFMEQTYGNDFIDELERLEQVVCSPSRVRQLAEDAIEYYSEALKAIDKQ